MLAVIYALLAVQSVAATPAATPAATRTSVPSRVIATSAAARTVAPKRVTAAYLRQHDPELVARILANADTPAGRSLAASVLPPEVLGNRGQAMTRLKPYFDGLRRPSGGLRPKGPTYETIVGDLPDTKKSLALGTGIRTKEGFWGPKGWFTGVATRTGPMSIHAGPGSPEILMKWIVVSNSTSQDPNSPDSYPSGKEPWHMEAGQSYQIQFELLTAHEGEYAKTFTIQDGQKTTLNVTGKVIASKTALGFSVESPKTPFHLTQKDHLVVTLRYAILTNLNATTTLNATCDLPGVSFEDYDPLPPLYSNKPLIGTTPYHIFTKYNAPDGAGTVTFTFGTMEGGNSAFIKVPIQIETVFTRWEDLELAEGTVHAMIDFTYSNAGYWHIEVHTWGLDDKIEATPLIALAFPQTNPAVVAPGFQFEGALKEQTDWVQVQIKNGFSCSYVHYWLMEGWDPRLRDVAAGTPLETILLVGKTGALASASPEWTAWQKAHPFSPLADASNLYESY